MSQSPSSRSALAVTLASHLGLLSGCSLVSKTDGTHPEVRPAEKTIPQTVVTINASSVASIGFVGDHTVHYMGKDKNAHVIDPDDGTPIIGPGRNTDDPNPPSVAYTKGCTPRAFARLLVDVGRQSKSLRTVNPTGLEWRIFGNKNKIAAGSSSLVSGRNTIDLGSHSFHRPLRQTPGREMIEVEVQVRYTGPGISEPAWVKAGGGDVICYCTEGTPNTPDGLRLVELYDAIMPAESDSRPGTTNSVSAPGEETR